VEFQTSEVNMFELLQNWTSLAVLALLFLLGASAQAEISVSFIPPEQWGLPDEDLGLGGGLVEDFEDLELAPGLFYEVSDATGNFTGIGSATLPNLFDPVLGDPYGDVFEPGVWDGTHVLVNTEFNQSIYYGSLDWHAVAFYIPDGTTWIALASCQVTGNHALVVNDQVIGRLGALGMELSYERNGVMIVSSDDPTNLITSVSFGGNGDAFVIDHVVFADPESLSDTSLSWGRTKALFR
jgi:hypothetical protein